MRIKHKSLFSALKGCNYVGDLTIKDIARMAGVSVSTASRAINNHNDVSYETRKKILKIIEENNFVPNSNAKNLKQISTNNIGIIVKGNLNTFFAVMVEHMQNTIGKMGYCANVCYIGEADDEIEAANRLFRERKLVGIIFLGGNINQFAKNFDTIKIPCVLATTSAHDLRFDNLSSVSVNDISSAQKAIDYLISNGHEDIAIISGDPDQSYLSRLRYQGCLNSFQNHKMKMHDELVECSGFSYKEGYEAMNRIIKRGKKFTAVFAMSDTMAIGAYKSLAEHGLRIPQDVSIMGFDGIELGQYLTPALTTIEQPAIRITDMSIQLLVEQIKSKVPGAHYLLETKIIERSSVAKINQ